MTNFKFVLDNLWGRDAHDDVARDWGYSDSEQMIYYESLTIGDLDAPHELDKVDSREVYNEEEV